jgi:hypothetical protein
MVSTTVRYTPPIKSGKAAGNEAQQPVMAVTAAIRLRLMAED